MKASIYYNPFEHPNSSERADALYWLVRNNDGILPLSKNYFKKWRFMGYEEVDQNKDLQKELERLFHKYNTENNPLGTMQGQKKVRELQAHTSMSVQDIIKIGDAYFMVAPFGFVIVEWVSDDEMISKGREAKQRILS